MSDVKFSKELESFLCRGPYIHKKGGKYEVLGLAKHSETLEDMVVYKAKYGNELMWVRPASMFLDEDRFTYTGEEFVESRCGLHCYTCEYKEPCNCGGCIETMGNPFHGECPVAKCCNSKGIIHCGLCESFPCELLDSYSNDPEHGDDPKGLRILQCKRWAKKRTQEEY